MVESIASKNLKIEGMFVWDAIKREKIDVLIQKLDHEGYPINHPVTDTGLTAFAYACSWSTNVDIFRLLLDRGADINAADLTGKMPVHHAALAGNVPALEVILELAQKDIEAQTNGLETPLMCAVRGQSVTSVATLLNGGSNPFIKNGLGETAQDIA